LDDVIVRGATSGRVEDEDALGEDAAEDDDDARDGTRANDGRGGGEEASEGERGRAGVDVGAGEAREGERGTREGGKRDAGEEGSRRRALAMDAGVAQRVYQRRESVGGVGAGDAERHHAYHGHERDDYSTHQVALAKV
jgi:hypothetical protein